MILILVMMKLRLHKSGWFAKDQAASMIKVKAEFCYPDHDGIFCNPLYCIPPPFRWKDLILIFKHIFQSSRTRNKVLIGLRVTELSDVWSLFWGTSYYHLSHSGLHIFSLKNPETLLTTYEKAGGEKLVYKGPCFFPWKCFCLTDMFCNWLIFRFSLWAGRQQFVRKKMQWYNRSADKETWIKILISPSSFVGLRLQIFHL